MTMDPSRPTILVVDDDVNIVKVFTIKLSSYGAKVVSARNGSEAFAVAAAEKPDVIVTDYTMPGGSGEVLIQRLQSDPCLKKTPVIVMTGRSFFGEGDESPERNVVGACGPVAFLAKPVDEDLFLAELQKHVTLPDY